MKNKLRITILYTIIFLFLLSAAYVCIGSPLPIYGQAIFEDGNVAEGALVNVTSDKGYLTTTSDYEGYWQIDCGDPINWPIGMPINIKINITKNGNIWQGEKNTTIDSNYVNTGTTILYSEYNSNNSADGDKDNNTTDDKSNKEKQETPGFSVLLIFVGLLIIIFYYRK